jgi:catechol 2,3-dioxygenase-like lactoylglutathione lyase family enzyme
MAESATPNLPALDLEATEAFYCALGFVATYRDHGWMIMERGGLLLEFFAYPDLDPCLNSFGACLRGVDAHAFFNEWSLIITARAGIPRLEPPRSEANGLTISYMLDLNGTLLRIIDDRD